MPRALCVVLGLLVFVQARHEQYEGHRLYRVTGPAEEIRSLDEQLDVWGSSPGLQSEVEAVLRLSPAEEERWLRNFDRRGLKYDVINENVAHLFRSEDVLLEKSRAAAQKSGKTITWDTYHRHGEINDYLDALAAEYPNLVTVINAAMTFEGRQLKYVRISTTRFENLMKPVIIIDAAVHAREWVTPPVALYLIHQLVVEQADPVLLDSIDWVIIPVANPDGYEFTFTDDRLWRKTRSIAHPGWDAGPNCIGVDGNRNFDHSWGTVESTRNPCTIVYEGPSPFSEPETAVIRNVVLQNVARTEMYISLHSYGNMFLYAWGNNATLPTNGLWLHLAGVTMAEAIEELALPEAPRYVVGNAAQVLYYTTGTSRDWTRAAGIPLTYTLELPGYNYLFEVPPTYIKQIVTETYAGIAAGAHFVVANI